MAIIYTEFVGNKAKERIAKRVFQENKARQISEKQTFIFVRTCTYQGKINVYCVYCYVINNNSYVINNNILSYVMHK